MATTIYEVNLTVDKDVASEYRDWLKGHIVEMLQFEGFESYQWSLTLPPAPLLVLVALYGTRPHARTQAGERGRGG